MTQAVQDSLGNPQKLWNTVKGLLHSEKTSALTRKGLSKMFSEFFTDKISKVHTRVENMKSQSTSATVPEKTCTGVFTDFRPVSVSEVKMTIAKLPNKTSPLDYLHTTVLKSCADVIAPLITHLVNASFIEGVFPQHFKLAQVTPLLKKVGLDADDPANYRPISNLSTIGKIIERLALRMLTPHIILSGNFNPLQSAYRKMHSTETALMKIMDDLYRIVDEKKAAVLIGLDLSAAFDTIDHRLLISRLKDRFGVAGSALNWLDSYLTGREQYVEIGGERSEKTVCNTGVPQGSVLGPFLFSLYVSPIADVITQFGIEFHQYADDTQLYTAVKSGSDCPSIKNLEQCTIAVKDWFLHNGMLLNPDKSEVLLVAGKAQARNFGDGSGIEVAGSSITYAVQLKSLGVIIDQKLSFDQHVNSMVRGANFHIKALRHIRPFLDKSTANTVACSIVGSRLDYCNSLLYGTSNKNIEKLQRVQNTLARIVSESRMRDHIRPVLQDLHWLPIAERIQYKIALVTHKVLITRQPQYLSEVLTEYKPVRDLRSSSQCKLASQTSRTNLGDRAFCKASSRVWNELPTQLRNTTNTLSFKKHLKTELFRRAYRE